MVVSWGRRGRPDDGLTDKLNDSSVYLRGSVEHFAVIIQSDVPGQFTEGRRARRETSVPAPACKDLSRCSDSGAFSLSPPRSLHRLPAALRFHPAPCSTPPSIVCLFYRECIFPSSVSARRSARQVGLFKKGPFVTGRGVEPFVLKYEAKRTREAGREKGEGDRMKREEEKEGGGGGEAEGHGRAMQARFKRGENKSRFGFK